MPELPEVETVVRGLSKYIIGRRIIALHSTLPRILVPDPLVVSRSIERTIIACSRRAKYIVLELDDGAKLTVHLRMTGRLLFEAPSQATQSASNEDSQRGAGIFAPYVHAVFDFDDGSRLHFADARTFGRIRYIEPGETWDAAIGIEPLSPAFTKSVLQQLVAKRTTAIKTLLLDQRHIAGIGNIYACEALWQAQIPPETAAATLRPAELTRLHAAIVDVLNRAVDLRGTSAKDYVDADGLRGGFQNVLAVYGLHGTPCKRCGSEIVRKVLAQRGTWYCPTCQKHRGGIAKVRN